MQLDCTELGMLMTIMKTSKDTDGKSLEMEWTLTPNSGGTPVHIHPEAIETYEILAVFHVSEEPPIAVFKG